MDIVLLNHPPKVVKGEFGNRCLACNCIFPLYIDEVGIDIVLNVIPFLLGTKGNPGGLKGHVLRVPIEFELLGMLIKFFNVMLSLGHKGDEFKLCRKAAFHSL